MKWENIEVDGEIKEKAIQLKAHRRIIIIGYAYDLCRFMRSARQVRLSQDDDDDE